MSQRSETRYKNDAMFSEGRIKGTDADISRRCLPDNCVLAINFVGCECVL